MAKGYENKRVAMNFPLETLNRIDDYAKRMSISRTSAVLVLCNMALDSQQALRDIQSLLKLSEVSSGGTENDSVE